MCIRSALCVTDYDLIRPKHSLYSASNIHIPSKVPSKGRTSSVDIKSVSSEQETYTVLILDLDHLVALRLPVWYLR
jgi:hypothetical protein